MAPNATGNVVRGNIIGSRRTARRRRLDRMASSSASQPRALIEGNTIRNAGVYGIGLIQKDVLWVRLSQNIISDMAGPAIYLAPDPADPSAEPTTCCLSRASPPRPLATPAARACRAPPLRSTARRARRARADCRSPTWAQPSFATIPAGVPQSLLQLARLLPRCRLTRRTTPRPSRPTLQRPMDRRLLRHRHRHRHRHRQRPRPPPTTRSAVPSPAGAPQLRRRLLARAGWR